MLRWLILLIALLPSAYLAYSAMDAPHLGRYHDDGLYWTAGRSIAEGSGYRILSLPGQPHQTKYPPAYPLLLSLVWNLFPSGSVAAAVWLNWLFVPLFTLTAYVVAADLGLNRNAALAVAVTVALHPLTALLGIHLLADLPFACLALLSLALAKRSMDNESTFRAFGSGVLAGLAYLVKTAAMPLLVIPAAFAWRRTFRPAAAAFAPFLIAVGAWHLWAHSNRSGNFVYYTDYLGQYFADLRIGAFTSMLARNLAQYVQAAGGVVVFNLYDGWQLITSIFLGVLAIAATARLFKCGTARTYAAFAGVYSLMLLGWNFPPNDRFLFPLMPILVASLVGHLGRTPVKIAAAAIVAGLTAIVTVNAFASGLPGFLEYQRDLQADRDRAFAWMRANAPGNAQVFTHFDSCFYLATSHTASRAEYSFMTYDPSLGDRVIFAFRELPSAARSRETYLIDTVGDIWRANATDAERDAALAFLRNSRAFRVIYRNRTVTVYRVSPD